MSLNNLRLIGFIITLILTFSCRKSEEENEMADTATDENVVHLTVDQYNSAGITTGSITSRNLSTVIHANGVLDVPPQNLVTVSALMGGFIKSTKLLQGMKVKKGETILTLQNPDFIQIQQDYLSNLSKLKYAEHELKREEELARENVSSVKTFQQVQSEYKALNAIHNSLQEKLKLAGLNPEEIESGSVKSTVNIHSPITGFVTAVNVNIGRFVHPQDIICEIVNTDHLHVELTVFEKDITRIKTGQVVRFNLVNEPLKERTAKVYLINRKISEDRTVRVHAHLDKEDPALIPNMYLKAKIEIQENWVNSLPETAVVSSGGKQFIYVPAENYPKTEGYFYRALEVRTGVTSNGFTELILPDSVSITTPVVIQGSYDLLSKQHNTEE